MTFPPLIIWAKALFFFEQLFPVVARTWLESKSVCLFLGPKFWFLVQKSNFCHTTPILVSDSFLALTMTVNFRPWEQFFDFPFRSYSCFRKQIWLTCQKVFPLPTVGALSASNSSALSGLDKKVDFCSARPPPILSPFGIFTLPQLPTSCLITLSKCLLLGKKFPNVQNQPTPPKLSISAPKYRVFKSAPSVQNVHNWPKVSRCIQNVQNHLSSKSVQNISEVTNTVQVSRSFQNVQNRQKMSSSAQKCRECSKVPKIPSVQIQSNRIDSRTL